MVSVALARPLWWAACRSLRFLTGLMMMALLLSAGGGPAASLGSPAPAGAQSTIASGSPIADTQSVPAQSVPAQSVPAQSVPAQSVPAQPVPAHSEAAPVGAESAPGRDVLADAGTGSQVVEPGDRRAGDAADRDAPIAGRLAVHFGEPGQPVVLHAPAPDRQPAGDAYGLAVGQRAPPLG